MKLLGRIALRSHANGKLVCAESDGNSPLIANRDAVGEWETFDLLLLDDVSEPEPTPIPPPSTPGRLIKVADGPFHPRFYSYWANAVVIGNNTFIFAGDIGFNPQFYRVNAAGQSHSLGDMGQPSSTTEGWYWDTTGNVYRIQDRHLLRANSFTGASEVVMSIASGTLWQPHSSDDGLVHSATVKEGDRKTGTVVNYRGAQRFFAARGALDESHITKDGEMLIILEDQLNRVIPLSNADAEWSISQEDGAVGHADTGWDFIVGEDDQHGACVQWHLASHTRRELFKTWNMGHVAVRGKRALISNATTLTLDVLDLDSGAMRTAYTHGINAGGDYDKQVRANLSPDGSRACFMMNGAVYLLEL